MTIRSGSTFNATLSRTDGRAFDRVEMFIPRWHPPSLNSVRNRPWHAEYRAKRNMRDLLAAYFIMAGGEFATGKRRVSLTLVMGKGQRRCDRSNLTKLLNDAMKAARIIKDDGPKWLEESEIQYTRGAEWGTRIVVEDLTEDAS